MNVNHALPRRGTRQLDRITKELSEEFVSVEERSVTDHLRFAKKIAKQIRYYDSDNLEAGTWAGLFSLEVDEIEAYLDNPADYQVDAKASYLVQEAQRKKLNELSQPHLVLFLVFLKLMQVIRERFKDISKRHLDYFYKEVLQLAPKQGGLDQVHLLLGNYGNEESQTIAKGTRVTAGVDSLGEPIEFEIENTIQVDNSNISQVKALQAARSYQTLHEFRKYEDDGFSKIIRWALGDKYQGDNLPPLLDRKGESIDISVDDLLELANKTKFYRFETDYIVQVLGFGSIEQFKTVFLTQTKYREANDTTSTNSVNFPSEEEWVIATNYLSKAFEKRWRVKEVEKLLAVYRPRLMEAGNTDWNIVKLFEYVWGSEENDYQLPIMPEIDDDLEKLYAVLNDQSNRSTNRYQLAARYINRNFNLSIYDFISIWQTHLEIEKIDSLDYLNALNSDARRSFFSKLQLAYEQQNNIRPPRSGRWNTKGFIANDIVDINNDVDESIFANTILENKDGERIFQPGLVISSPLLRLSSGSRNVEIDLFCESSNFPFKRLTALQQDQLMNVTAHLSTKTDWLTFDSKSDPTKAKIELRHFPDRVTRRIKNNQLSVSLSIESLPKNVRDDLIAAHASNQASGIKGTARNYLVLSDDSIWQVLDIDATNKMISANYATSVKGFADNRDFFIASADFSQPNETFYSSISSLENIKYSRTKKQLKNTTKTPLSHQLAVGDFALWLKGEVLLVNHIASDGSVATVESLGYLPGNWEAYLIPNRLSDLSISTNAQRTGSKKSLKYWFEFNKKSYIELNLSNQLSGFTKDSIEQLVSLPNGLLLTINALTNKVSSANGQEYYQSASATLFNGERNALVNGNDIFLYSSLPGFRISLHLDKSAKAIVPLTSQMAINGLSTEEATIKLEFGLSDKSHFNHTDARGEFFDAIKNVSLKKARLAVKVDSLSGIKVETDESSQSADKPFAPFGYRPFKGASFFIGHDELNCKKLTNMQLKLKWGDLPESLSEHYQSYSESNLKGIPQVSLESFYVDIDMFNFNGWIPLQRKSLLFDIDADSISSINIDKGFKRGGYSSLVESVATLPDTPKQMNRYYRLTLSGEDFLHDFHPHVVKHYAIRQDESIVNEPISPKILNFEVSYTSEVEIDVNRESEEHQLSLLQPFGIKRINSIDELDKSSTSLIKTNSNESRELLTALVPQLDFAGALYIGLQQAKANSDINLLFQLGINRRNKLESKLDVEWLYLSQNGWQVFSKDSLIDDGTRAFSRSGIMRFHLPKDASNHSKIMGDNNHWIVARVKAHADVIPEILKIETQGVSARRVANPNASWFSSLSPHSINTFSNNNSLISIQQPYSSTGASAEETESDFYFRARERLRHRNRAVSTWDIERLILSQFSDISLAKCTYNQVPGELLILVLPNLTSTNAKFVLKPSVPATTLLKIKEYIAERATPNIKIVVKNPQYREVRFRLNVKFNVGYGSGNYIDKVNESIKGFLTPWNAANQSNPDVGQTFFYSELVYHLEKLPFVDYISGLVGYVLESRFPSTANEYQYWKKIVDNKVESTSQNQLIVSYENHLIDVINEEYYRDELHHGIGHMIVELDNQIT